MEFKSYTVCETLVIALFIACTSITRNILCLTHANFMDALEIFCI